MDRLDQLAWWEAEGDAVHMPISAAFTHLRENDEREQDYRTFASLYSNREIQSAGIAGYYRASHSASNKYSRVPYNIIKLHIDTVTARIAKMRPRALFQTEGGDFTIRRKADRLQKWIDLQFYEADVYKTAPSVFRDACMFGIGILHPYREGKTIKVERVYPGEIFVDEYEAFNGDPRQLFRRKYISRHKAKELFPGKKDELEFAGTFGGNEDQDLAFNPLMDQIEIVQAWFLGSDGTPGKTVIFTSNCVLEQREYTYKDFPFCFVRWDEEVRGFFGIGLAEDLLGIHQDVNKTIRRIEKSIENSAGPQVWLQQNSKVSASQITNVPGGIASYSGEKPIFAQVQQVPADLFQYLKDQEARAQQISRLSNAAFGNKIPSGLETGAAVRNFHDIESETFALPAQQYEELFAEVARKLIRLGKEISVEFPKHSVVAEVDRNTIEKVPWKDVLLDEEKEAFVLKIYPASSLPISPAGKMAAIESFINMGMVTPAVGMELLGFPDLENHLTLERATSRNIDRIIDKILNTGEYEAPEPYMDLQLAMKKGQAAVNNAAAMGVDYVTIDRLRRFVKACSTMMKRAQQEAMALQQATFDPAAGMPPGPDGMSPAAITGKEPL